MAATGSVEGEPVVATFQVDPASSPAQPLGPVTDALSSSARPCAAAQKSGVVPSSIPDSRWAWAGHQRQRLTISHVRHESRNSFRCERRSRTFGTKFTHASATVPPRRSYVVPSAQSDEQSRKRPS